MRLVYWFMIGLMLVSSVFAAKVLTNATYIAGGINANYILQNGSSYNTLRLNSTCLILDTVPYCNGTGTHAIVHTTTTTTVATTTTTLIPDGRVTIDMTDKMVQAEGGAYWNRTGYSLFCLKAGSFSFCVNTTSGNWSVFVG